MAILRPTINSSSEHMPSGYYWCALYGDNLIKESFKTISEYNDIAKTSF